MDYDFLFLCGRTCEHSVNLKVNKVRLFILKPDMNDYGLGMWIQVILNFCEGFAFVFIYLLTYLYFRVTGVLPAYISVYGCQKLWN